MTGSSAADTIPEPGVVARADSWPSRPASWGISLLVHGGLLIVFALALRPPPPSGTGAENETSVGLAIRAAPVEYRSLEGDESAEQSPSSAADSARFEPVAEIAEAMVAVAETSPLAKLLPQFPGRAEPGDLSIQRPFSASATSGAGASGKTIGTKARVSLFGITGEGNKFVYIFDRSDSMNWFNRRPLLAAKAELIASLDGLGETHQFQIIFYNHEPLVFNPTGQAYRLAFGTDDNKARAKRFVESITATGGTRHMEAILVGLSFQPDVIFLLTDADDPQLTDAQVASIIRRRGGTTIHTIEFGYGPQKNRDNFLVRLARLSGGQHVYVDISQL